MFKKFNVKAGIISFLIIFLYGISVWVLFEIDSLNLWGIIYRLPFAIAYGFGYQYGVSFFYLFVLIEIVLAWLIFYLIFNGILGDKK